jgi:hypothetical protein
MTFLHGVLASGTHLMSVVTVLLYSLRYKKRKQDVIKTVQTQVLGKRVSGRPRSSERLRCFEWSVPNGQTNRYCTVSRTRCFARDTVLWYSSNETYTDLFPDEADKSPKKFWKFTSVFFLFCFVFFCGNIALHYQYIFSSTTPSNTQLVVHTGTAFVKFFLQVLKLMVTSWYDLLNSSSPPRLSSVYIFFRHRQHTSNYNYNLNAKDYCITT